MAASRLEDVMDRLNNECVICGHNYKLNPDPDGWDGGHNARPVAEGQCCGKCNDSLVTPLRMEMLVERWEAEKE